MHVLSYIGGIIGFSVLVWFAYGVWFKKIPATTPASWLMWTVLDAILLVTTIASGKAPWLPLGWTIGATLVTIACFVRGTWTWSYKETISAIGSGISIYLSYKWGHFAGLLGAIFAMNIAGIPITVDMWRNPVRESTPVWVFTVVACLFTLLGSDWSKAGIVLALSSMAYNGAMAIIARFKNPSWDENWNIVVALPLVFVILAVLLWAPDPYNSYVSWPLIGLGTWLVVKQRECMSLKSAGVMVIMYMVLGPIALIISAINSILDRADKSIPYSH